MNSLPIEDRIAKLASQLQKPETVQELTSDVFRKAAQMVIEQMLEAEVDDRLGRQRYQRHDVGESEDARKKESIAGGYRNGHKPRQLRTAEGKIPIELPQVRDAEGWSSQVWPKLRSRSEVLDKLASEMYARGLSTRDVEDLLGEIEDGDGQPVLSKSSVSRISEVLWEEYEAFSRRDLSGMDVVYLFCDAVYESLRQQAGCKEAILVTWAVLLDGSKALVHMSLGHKESQTSWQEHFRSLISRACPIR